MAQQLLEGSVTEMPTDRVQELREEFEEFQRQMREALARILQQVSVIRQGLSMAGGDESFTAPAGGIPPQFDQRWEAWKQKLGSTTAAARVIQAILDHGPLNRSQLRQATKSGWSTLDEATARLKNLQLIEKLGDRWNLKG